MTAKFCRDVLAGRKKLLKQSAVLRVEEIPNFKEFSTERVWLSLKNKDDAATFLQYFPDYGERVLPSN